MGSILGAVVFFKFKIRGSSNAVCSSVMLRAILSRSVGKFSLKFSREICNPCYLKKMKIQMLLFALCSPPKEATANLRYINNFSKSGKEGKKKKRGKKHHCFPHVPAAVPVTQPPHGEAPPAALVLGAVWAPVWGREGNLTEWIPCTGTLSSLVAKGHKNPGVFFWSEGQIVPPPGPTLGVEGVLPPLTSGPCGASSRKGRGRGRPIGLDPGRQEGTASASATRSRPAPPAPLLHGRPSLLQRLLLRAPQGHPKVPLHQLRPCYL